MAHIYISLHDEAATPTVSVLRIEQSGERFISIAATDGCTIALPGRDHVTVKHAFALADALVDAARELRTQLEQEPKAVTA